MQNAECIMLNSDLYNCHSEERSDEESPSTLIPLVEGDPSGAKHPQDDRKTNWNLPFIVTYNSKESYCKKDGTNKQK